MIAVSYIGFLTPHFLFLINWGNFIGSGNSVWVVMDTRTHDELFRRWVIDWWEKRSLPPYVPPRPFRLWNAHAFGFFPKCWKVTKNFNINLIWKILTSSKPKRPYPRPPQGRVGIEKFLQTEPFYNFSNFFLVQIFNGTVKDTGSHQLNITTWDTSGIKIDAISTKNLISWMANKVVGDTLVFMWY